MQRDAVGLLPPSETGFARALWGPDSTSAVLQAIESHPGQGVPAAQALFTEVSSTMRIAREEIFGPVVGMTPVNSLDEAITMINAASRTPEGI